MQAHETTEAVAEETTLRQEWRTALAPWKQATLAALPIFLLTRLLILILTYFGGILFTVQNNSSFALTFNTLLYSWYHWDAPRNITIATQGYSSASYTQLFPLYPAIIHIVSAAFKSDILLTSIVISNLAFLGLLIVLYRLVTTEFDATTASRSILYLSIFPTALFFFSAYNSALLLLLVLLCLYALRRGYWWLAGCIGGLAALTDLTGVLLFIIFLCEYGRQRLSILQQSRQAGEKREFLRQIIPVLAAFLIPLGLAIYCYGLSKPFHDPLIFLHTQSSSGETAPGTIPALLQAFKGGSLYTYAAAHALFEIMLLLGMLTLLVLSITGPWRFNTQQWPLWIFGALILLYPLFMPQQPGTIQTVYDPLPAIQYAALLFVPGFILLARLGKHPRVHHTYLIVSTSLLAFLIFQLFLGRWAL